ncbi:hypothetical protein ACRALDRAFT_2040888 [Sodiomyces alcalophilus JCM 7366]|uniref:uncharacterized protein n=1 Tax=Sodiomyces alcalophilus JCM 7366 TaxID=591952 RepID=UPI0039B459DF
MADAKPPPTPPEPAAAATSTAPKPNASPSSAPGYKALERNPAFRMLGLPSLPRKLPSRNWMIFFTVTGSFSAAVIYDRREKKRATARWARAVAPLASEPVPNPSQLPRKLTVMLSAPPGEGVRVAQDHFLEYIKPVLAASGLDWEFIQGRAQGDIRAAVAERIRRRRRLDEKPDELLEPTEEAIREEVRRRNNIPEYVGDAGDIVIGRNTWKEYIRGLHEGWLGPLDLPPHLQPPPPPPPAEEEATTTEDGATAENQDKKKEEEEKEKKPERPPQPLPHNTTDEYSDSPLPRTIPGHFSPSAPIQFPHILGFLNTPTRLVRFLNRRALADDIGRQVAAVCFAANREWREEAEASSDDRLARREQELALEWEEKNWIKSVWKTEADDEEDKKAGKLPKEKVWTNPMVLDPRITSRMRRFELLPEDEERARAIVIPEEVVEGWIKRNLRSLYRWGAGAWQGKPKGPNVGNIDDVVV